MSLQLARPQSIKIIRKPEVLSITGLSRTTHQTRISEGLMPPPISIGARAVGFIFSEIQTVLAARSIGKSDDEIKDIVKSLLKQRQTSANALLATLAA
jgi:prophage regulatory protein